MATSNHERIGQGLQLLAEGLYDIVDEVMTREFGSTDWNTVWAEREADRFNREPLVYNKNDVSVQLKAITEKGVCFKDVLSRGQQSFAQELREVRNAWAHNDQISSDDTLRALDTMERLLHAVDANDSAADVRRLREGLQRTVASEQTRSVVRRQVNVSGGAGLTPWREVLNPHDDVASGNYNASDFAANLFEVANGISRNSEYSDPREFFERTYLTEGLYDLLSRAVRRMNGDRTASPVVNLQTNFGGGKTHSLLALYHLFGSTPLRFHPQELQELVAGCDVSDLAGLNVKRVVLVGNEIQAASPSIKPDGTSVNTIWGELAWQLAGRAGYDLVADADRTGTNPGEALRTVITQNTPCLILIDEWVAYARQMIGHDYPSGTFDTQFTFAQSLTEIVSATPGAMLVVSIPASDSLADVASGNEIEVGGEHGRQALQRLLNVIGRMADQWRPSSKDESFEIVRRRLFQEPDQAELSIIRATARGFSTMYRGNPSAFPREAALQSEEYEQRIIASYPLHPELLDRLYEDWSTLLRFQRTRGVLRLVNSIVHALWLSDDSSPLIMPGLIPLDDTDVLTDLTQYLDDSWKPIIDADIDNAGSTAAEIDQARPNLGQRHITRRLARTVFLGSAPKAHSANMGLDRQRVWLGTAIPGDQLGSFSTAIDLLQQSSTYLYAESDRYWFDTQASITKTARDRAEQLREDPELIYNEIVRRLAVKTRQRDVFERIHVAPESGADIPDAESVRLVVVHPRFVYRRGSQSADSDVYRFVQRAVESRGTGQRLHRNTLVFAIADGSAADTLETATREYLAWQYVQANAEAMNLSVQQQGQAGSRVAELDSRVDNQIEMAYIWAAYPEQVDPTAPFTIEFTRLSEGAGNSLASRVASKLQSADQLVRLYAPGSLGWALRKNLANVWQRGEVSVGELWSYFTQYVYMDRLANRAVLDQALLGAFDALGFENEVDERFAVALGKDAQTGHYIGLMLPPDTNASLQITDSTMLVDWEVALRQILALAGLGTDESGGQIGVMPVPGGDATPPVGNQPTGETLVTPPTEPPKAAASTRYIGAVDLSPDLYAKSFSTISREVIDRLAAAGASLSVRLEIQATKSSGFTEDEIRTIKENSTSLGFEFSGFEEE